MIKWVSYDPYRTISATDGVKKQKSSLLLIVEGYCQVLVYHTVHITLSDPNETRNMPF